MCGLVAGLQPVVSSSPDVPPFAQDYTYMYTCTRYIHVHVPVTCTGTGSCSLCWPLVAVPGYTIGCGIVLVAGPGCRVWYLGYFGDSSRSQLCVCFQQLWLKKWCL